MINEGDKTLCLIPKSDPTFEGDLIVFGLCADTEQMFYRINSTAIMHDKSGLCFGVSVLYNRCLQRSFFNSYTAHVIRIELLIFAHCMDNNSSSPIPVKIGEHCCRNWDRPLL